MDTTLISRQVRCVRTVIPANVVRALELRPGDRVIWLIGEIDGVPVVRVQHALPYVLRKEGLL